jgi:hypothetical protein
MDKAAAEKEAIRLWHNLPLQDRLAPSQAIAFAAMIAPTLDFDEPHQRTEQVERWLLRDLPRTDPSSVHIEDDTPGRRNLPVPPWPQREGAPGLALVICLLIMLARRTDIVTNAMLWAEDGTVWFAQAYNEGWWAPLLRPYGGYLEVFPRLVFDVATLLPLRFVALFGVWVALLVRAALPAFLFSSRFTSIDWRAKVAITAYYVLMPNLGEVHANIANTGLYLGLYLIAVILADPPRRLGWKIHDWVVLVLAGSTGPLVLFALPALVWRYAAQRRSGTARPAFLGVAVLLALVQVLSLVLTVKGTGAFATTPLLPLQILGSRVFLGFITPARWAGALSDPSVAIPAFFFGAAILVAVFVRGDWKARGLLVIPPLLLLAGFFTPAFSLAQPQWTSVFDANPAERYFVVTSVAWAGTLVYFAGIYLPRLSSFALAVSIAICGFFILFDFPLPPVPGASFGPQVDRIVATPVGESVTVPTAPPGWAMTLVRH